MATDVVRTVPGITVAIARDPALVRTVRLVAAAVARRASHDEEFVEEVRLAVGEACALMVAADATADDPVTIRLSTNGRLHVAVSASGRVPWICAYPRPVRHWVSSQEKKRSSALLSVTPSRSRAENDA